ncbi:MAG: lipocalin-like domain-containing protein [candidate division WOR-3 bacterium]
MKLRLEKIFSIFFMFLLINCAHHYQKYTLDLTKDVQIHKGQINWYYTYILTENQQKKYDYFVIVFQYFDANSYFSNIYIKDILKDTFYYYETNVPIYSGMKNFKDNNDFENLSFDINFYLNDLQCSINFDYDNKMLINGDSGYIIMGHIKDTAGYYSLISKKLTGFIKTDKVNIDLTKISNKYGWFDHQWGNMKLDIKNRWIWSGIFLGDDKFLVSGHFKNQEFNFLQYHNLKDKKSMIYKNTFLDTITYRKSLLSRKIYEYGFLIRSKDDSIYLFYEPLYDECFIPGVIFTGPCKVKGFINENYYEGIGAFEISDPVDDSTMFYPYDFYKSIFSNSKKVIEQNIKNRKKSIKIYQK